MGSEKLIQDLQQIEAVLLKAKFISIALSDAETPYIVPMSFGYKENAIHSSSVKR
jgi:nitroimidazol reductase NimA-like FMN-containing flavoprotein (pyridoxamine 5'-phosphate oxidase superfamily)